MTSAQLFGALLAAACGSALAATHTVVVEGMAFQPATLKVRQGDTVVWRNRDVVPHTATAAGRFDSGQIGAGQAWSWTAKDKGQLGYVCTYHPGMKGVVVVE
jgi:plastocyanin